MTETPTQSNISEQMHAAIGRTLSRQVSFPVSESDIRRWALAVYYPDAPPPRFIDPASALQTRHGGIVAPEEFNPFAWLVAEDDEDGRGLEVDGNDPGFTELRLGIAPPALKFQLNGGLEVEYGVPIRPGDVIRSRRRLVSYSERSGRLGLMLFTVFEDTWTNQNRELVKRTRSTLIRY
jgi:hypothetical protein